MPLVLPRGQALIAEIHEGIARIKDAGQKPEKVYIGPDEDRAIAEYLTEAGLKFGGSPVTTLDGGLIYLVPIVVSPDVRVLVT